ncbi:ABC transporter permease [Intestinibaculum porci]|uniref:ABC transporter permease n=1 Tax=Intestinibaculum porci TaxID=2487118 RepID=UPI002409A9C6|nr:ABC transporter permease [Intestinibaculum porci]MDD6349430.1 ABC transporter permease [Intestinibaculum porci]MDD6422837.1 ABC transporter permease [Intestinibaculum porci]
MVLKNALLSIKKSIGKSLLLLVIMALIANLVLAGLAIKKATERSMAQVRSSMGATATLSYNMQKLMQNRKKGASMASVMKAMKMSTADQLKHLKYVQSYNYSVSVGVNSSSIDPVKVSNSSSSNTQQGTPPGGTSSSGSAQNKMTETSFSVSGNTTMKKISSFTNGGYKLISGRLLNSSDDGKNYAVISSALASDNDLKVGSSFKVYSTTSSGKKTYVTLKVIGIYKIQSSSASMDNMSDRQNPYNTIYTPLKTAQTLNHSTTTITSATYYLDDPAHTSAFAKLAKKTSINWNTYALQTSDEAYEASVSSLKNMEKFANIFLVVVIAAGAIILALILILTLRSRFYEFGVFLSLGESKAAIIAQQLVEVGLIAVLAFMLSLGTGKMVANSISSMLTSTSTQTTVSASSSQKGPSGPGAQGGPGRMMQNAMTSPTNKQLDVSVSASVIGELAGISAAICLLSIAVPSIYILRLSPRQILMKKEG